MQVVAAALEDRVRALEDLDVEVAGGAVAGADLTLTGELDAGAGVDSGGDAHGHRPASADASLARAVRAGVRDDRAETAALRAGAGTS